MVAPVILISDSEAYRKLLVVDEFGELYREKQAWFQREKRFDALTEEIRSWYPNLAPEATEIAMGAHYEIQVGEKPIEKYWKSMALVYKAAGGMKPFLKLCTVTFKALSVAIGSPAATALQTEDRTGKRRLKAVARLAVELPKAA